LAFERLAHLLQRFKVDAKRFAFFQTPERSVTNTGLFSQPVKGSPVLCQ
jgi:hypothetical protein